MNTACCIRWYNIKTDSIFLIQCTIISVSPYEFIIVLYFISCFCRPRIHFDINFVKVFNFHTLWQRFLHSISILNIRSQENWKFFIFLHLKKILAELQKKKRTWLHSFGQISGCRVPSRMEFQIHEYLLIECTSFILINSMPRNCEWTTKSIFVNKNQLNSIFHGIEIKLFRKVM